MSARTSELMRMEQLHTLALNLRTCLRMPSFTNEGSPGLAHFHRSRPTNVGNMKMALSVALMEHSFSLVSMLQMSCAASPLMSLMTTGHGDKHISSKRDESIWSVPSCGSELWFRVTCSVPNARQMPGQV